MNHEEKPALDHRHFRRDCVLRLFRGGGVRPSRSLQHAVPLHCNDRRYVAAVDLPVWVLQRWPGSSLFLAMARESSWKGRWLMPLADPAKRAEYNRQYRERNR